MRPEAPTIHPKRAGPESGTLRHLAGSHALRAPVDALRGRMDEREASGSRSLPIGHLRGSARESGTMRTDADGCRFTLKI